MTLDPPKTQNQDISPRPRCLSYSHTSSALLVSFCWNSSCSLSRVFTPARQNKSVMKIKQIRENQDRFRDLPWMGTFKNNMEWNLKTPSFVAIEVKSNLKDFWILDLPEVSAPQRGFSPLLGQMLVPSLFFFLIVSVWSKTCSACSVLWKSCGLVQCDLTI